MVLSKATTGSLALRAAATSGETRMPCVLVSVWFEWREAVWVERSGEDEVEACGQLSFFFSFSL